MPSPIIVMKDVGGFVSDYENQTALYRASNREVRLHECRSACTLALSLPNVCVYPDSKLKFHLAYDPRDHQTNASVSQQMLDTYPAAVRARLGTLTREYKVLSGNELIALGIRDCNAPKGIEPRPSEPKVMVATAAPRKPPLGAQPQTAPETPVFASLMGKVMSVFGTGETTSAMSARATIAPPRAVAKQAPGQVLVAEIPLPPPRPVEFAQTTEAAVQTPPPPSDQETKATSAIGQTTDAPARAESAEAAPLPPSRPANAALSAIRRLVARIPLPKLITGAQPILPPDFSAYADMDR
jgi:hypothetical protein